MKKRQFIILGVTLGILIGSGGLMAYLSSLKEPPKQFTPPPVKKYVQTAPVMYNDIRTDVRAYGRVQTAQALDLIPEVSGRMFEGNIRLKEGAKFKKGQLIFYIDSREAALSLKSQKSNFLRDLAAILPDLKLDFPDNYTTWETYFASIDLNEDLPQLPEEIGEQERTFLATKGIFSNYYNIKSAEVRLTKYNYYAPWDGSVSEVAFETGAFVNPGTRIGKVIRAGAHELKVSVETQDIPWIQVGSEVKIYSDEMNHTWDGWITRMSDFVNQNTQSIDVVIAINEKNQRVYDGQFLRASIPAQVIKDGMIIPRNVIYNGNEVFVVEDTLLKSKIIDVYRISEEDAIFGGLDEGEDIVVEPLLNAHNNMSVFKAEQRDIDLETGTNNKEIAASEESAN